MSHFRDAIERCGCGHIPADPSHGPRPFRLPGDPERFGRPRPFQIEHLKLEARLDVPRRRITAVATLRVSQRDPDARVLVLDAVGFEIEKVTTDDGRALPHRYDGDALHVTLAPIAPGGHAQVAITYSVEPRRGLYFMRPDERTPQRPYQVWSQCQDEDAKFWIPCHDFPNMRMSTEFVITAPEGWTVLSNGKLVSREKIAGSAAGELTPASTQAYGPGEERWHWLQEAPHVAYLMTLVAGTFTELSADLRALPVRYYVDPGREEDGWRSFGRTPEMIDHFGELTGVTYPWAKYYQVCVHDFIFGGMENTSATTMTDRILIDARAALDNTADDIVAHELAHQWFGDLVTCRDWSHAWLNEGFATYFEHLDWEKKSGRDAYLYNLKEHADSYIGEDEGRYRRPVVCNTYAYPIDLFDRHLYEKGAWVLHMLRAELGSKLFFGGVKRYLERHRGGIVETRDLLRAMEDESGRSLEGFFDQWLYRAGFPELEVECAHEAERGVLALTVRQTQKVDDVTPLFRLRLRVSVVGADDGREELHELEITEASQAFVLRCAQAPARVAIDPDGAHLMRLSQKLPRDWLLDALANDKHAIVRWRAAAALARRDEQRVATALAKAVRDDAFWGVGAEAARALGESRSEKAQTALIELLDVPHPKVRRAVVRALGDYRNEASARALLAHIARGDESVQVEGELLRSAGRTRQAIVYDALVAGLERTSWRDVVRVGAIDGLATLRDERAHPLIDRFADPGNGLGTRRAAVAALGEFGENKRTVRERLEALLEANDPYLTPEVMRSLGRLKDPAAIGAIASLQARSLDGRVKRHARETLRELRSREHPDDVRRLSDALDRLRDETQVLRDELARIKVLALPDEDAGARKPARKPAGRAAKPARGARRTGASARAKGAGSSRKTRGGGRR